MRRASLLTLAAVLLLAPAADAKFRMRLTLSPGAPRSGEPVRVRLRTEAPLEASALMRLVVVAPGANLMDVVAKATGNRPGYPAVILDSFAVRLTQATPTAWVGEVTFARPGRWRLVIPNFGVPGYAIPPPLVRTVLVAVR
jgi:hypothetical protein